MSDSIKAPWRAGPYRTVIDAFGLEVCDIRGGFIEDAEDRKHLIAAAPDLLSAHEDGPDLDWYADRLVNVHGESETADFIVALRRKSARLRAAALKARGQ